MGINGTYEKYGTLHGH
jgi:hypothetical protein